MERKLRSTPSFTYFDPVEAGFDSTSSRFSVRVPAGILTVEELFGWYSKAVMFPEFFGWNWDAFLDCLRDLSWISQKEVQIVHEDVPLHRDEAERRIYLEILQTALLDWSEKRDGPGADLPADWLYIEHDLEVTFPVGSKVLIGSTIK